MTRRGLEPGDDVLKTHMLVSGIFKQFRTFVVVPDVLSIYSKIGNVITGIPVVALS